MKAAAWERCTLWLLLSLYALARVSQLFAGTLPSLLIVVLHVVPAALFAVLHGRRVLGGRVMVVFATLCVGIAATFESLSLRTGFPFGHYFFTALMGPQIAHLPVLLALAYLGMGYASWCVAWMIVGTQRRIRPFTQLVSIPLLATVMMVAWDISMDPVWANLDRAWVWKDGGAYFGVPISNFLGWLLTVTVVYITFALLWKPKSYLPTDKSWLRMAALFYAISAIGNLFVIAPPLSPAMVMDASGLQWQVSKILWATRIVSVAVMLPFAVLGWTRYRQRPNTG